MPSFEDTNEYDKPHYINEGNRAENREIVLEICLTF